LNQRKKLSTNQNMPFSLTWIKGPTRTCNWLRIVPSRAPLVRGPTFQPPSQRSGQLEPGLGQPNQVVQPNQPKLHRLKDSTWQLPIGPQYRFSKASAICSAATPLGHTYKYEGRGEGRIRTHLKLLSLKFLSCLAHRIVEFRLK
jgi:hypothetical protein